MQEKFTSFLVLALIFVNMFAVSAFAETAPSVTVGNAKGETGTTVEIPIILENNKGFSNLGIEIGYDETALTLANAVASSSVGATFTKAQDFTVHPFNMSWDSASNTTFNGTLVTLTFEIITDKAGTYPITVDYYKGRNGDYINGNNVNYDDNFEPLGLKYVSGCISVSKLSGDSSPLISAGEISFDGGISFDVTLEADSYTGSITAGLYSADNILKSVTVYPAAETLEVSFDKGQAGAYVKIMWWEDINSMIPVCNAQTIPLQ